MRLRPSADAWVPLGDLACNWVEPGEGEGFGFYWAGPLKPQALTFGRA